MRAGGAASAPRVPDPAISGSSATNCKTAKPTKEPAENPHTRSALWGVIGTAGTTAVRLLV